MRSADLAARLALDAPTGALRGSGAHPAAGPAANGMQRAAASSRAERSGGAAADGGVAGEARAGAGAGAELLLAPAGVYVDAAPAPGGACRWLHVLAGRAVPSLLKSPQTCS